MTTGPAPVGNRLDPAGLETRLAGLVDVWAPGATIDAVTPLFGGMSSLTFMVELTNAPADHERIVIKAAPPGLEPIKNRDVLRQARLLSALEKAPDVPAPPVLFTDAGTPPEVPPLFAMGFVDGECYEPILDPVDVPPPPDQIHGRMMSAARALAALHLVSPAGVGLGNEPEVPLREQVDRWTRCYETVGEDLRPRYEECRDLLLARMPAALPTALSHGDYRVGNTLCRGDRVMAIIDWEIWAREDPRIDLAWFLLWVDRELPSQLATLPPGVPERADVLAEYLKVTARPVADLAWFEAQSQYKQGAIIALMVKRNRRSAAPAPEVEHNVNHLPALIVRAIDTLRARG
jgi:aminoglycoside phosphotransferase (APT) family kinase protein